MADAIAKGRSGSAALSDEGLRVAFDLAETAERIMAQNLRRRNPDASPQELRRLLREWLHHRPGAEHGDGVGRATRRELPS